MNLQECLYHSTYRSSLKHYLAHALCEIRHSTCGLDTNKALSFVSYFISISAVYLMLYFTLSTGGNASTITLYIFDLAENECK